MKYHILILLVISWWVGAATATAALFFPVYGDYLVVSSGGWIIVAVSTGLIFLEMRRIKAEDKKKEDLKNS